MNLVDMSDTYKETADAFLSNSALLTLLGAYGKVEFEGAYAGNVMLHGDVDIRVVRDRDFSTDEIFLLARELHDSLEGVRSVFLKADWDDPRIGGLYPVGRYIGLKLYIGSERWKFDIWLVSEINNIRKEGIFDIAKVSLTQQQREKILEFKKYRKDHALKTSGQSIYEAVIQDGCVEPDVFFSKVYAENN